MTDHNADNRIEALEERVAQLEEQNADLAVDDPDGKRVTLSGLLDLGLTRRQALAAIGLVAYGSTMTVAVMKAIGTAAADEGPGVLYGIDQIGSPDERVDTVYVDEVNSIAETEDVVAETVSTGILGLVGNRDYTIKIDGTIDYGAPSVTYSLDENYNEVHLIIPSVYANGNGDLRFTVGDTDDDNYYYRLSDGSSRDDSGFFRIQEDMRSWSPVGGRISIWTADTNDRANVTFDLASQRDPQNGHPVPTRGGIDNSNFTPIDGFEFFNSESDDIEKLGDETIVFGVSY